MAAAGQVRLAGLRRGLEFRVALQLVAGAPERAVGTRVREVWHAVVPDALRELPRLRDEGGAPAVLLVRRAWGERAAGLQGGLELRVALQLVARAAEVPLRVRVREVGHAVFPDAL